MKILKFNVSAVYSSTTVKPYTGPLNTTPYPGCAAALKCVPEIYCTIDGVMSDTPVVITYKDLDNKVPLTVSKLIYSNSASTVNYSTQFSNVFTLLTQYMIYIVCTVYKII